MCRIHTEETKKKLSQIRIEYLKKNPDKVPYKLNHKHKETYPEIYFKECLKGFIYQYRIPNTLYVGDFVNPILKVIIEIDGEQHYVDNKIIIHDIKRTEILENLGWKIIRIRWKSFIVLDRNKKEEVISNINLNAITNVDIEEYIKKEKKCADCDNIVKDTRSIRCSNCSRTKNGINSRRFNISKDELIELLNRYSLVKIGKMFGVSGNAIKKRCIKLEIPLTRFS